MWVTLKLLGSKTGDATLSRLPFCKAFHICLLQKPLKQTNKNYSRSPLSPFLLPKAGLTSWATSRNIALSKALHRISLSTPPTLENQNPKHCYKLPEDLPQVVYKRQGYSGTRARQEKELGEGSARGEVGDTVIKPKLGSTGRVRSRFRKAQPLLLHHIKRQHFVHTKMTAGSSVKQIHI